MENVLHELLHYYAMYNYVPYRDGVIPACEEYEMRVLTDVIMQKYCANCDFKYQGMSPDELSGSSFLKAISGATALSSSRAVIMSPLTTAITRARGAA